VFIGFVLIFFFKKPVYKTDLDYVTLETKLIVVGRSLLVTEYLSTMKSTWSPSVPLFSWWYHLYGLLRILLTRLGRLSKESVQVRGPLRHFVTSLFFRWGVVSPTPNPQAGGSPLVGSPRLLIQYIRSYPPYLEGVSSIRNVRTRHAVVTRDPPNMDYGILSPHITEM
jgi:hypothetical protein